MKHIPDRTDRLSCRSGQGETLQTRGFVQTEERDIEGYEGNIWVKSSSVNHCVLLRRFPQFNGKIGLSDLSTFHCLPLWPSRQSDPPILHGSPLPRPSEPSSPGPPGEDACLPPQRLVKELSLQEPFVAQDASHMALGGRLTSLLCQKVLLFAPIEDG